VSVDVRTSLHMKVLEADITCRTLHRTASRGRTSYRERYEMPKHLHRRRVLYQLLLTIQLKDRSAGLKDTMNCDWIHKSVRKYATPIEYLDFGERNRVLEVEASDSPISLRALAAGAPTDGIRKARISRRRPRDMTHLPLPRAGFHRVCHPR
jgi:hypothetical protein